MRATESITDRLARAARRLVLPVIKPGARQITEAKRRMERELRASGYSRSAAKAMVSRAFGGGDA